MNRDAKRRLRIKKAHPYCERCFFFPKSLKELHVHEKNRDHYDLRPENIEVLCVKCHVKEHRGEKF